jgi:transposase
MLAEWGDCRQASPQADSAAMLGGLCPVTHASGTHRDVSFRWACNKRLRQAMTTFANNSRRASPWAAEVYRQAIARGCDHPHAVRILARAWTRVIWRCWQDHRAYDPALHRAARRLKAA